MDDTHKWYLMKHDDGTVFGPIGFDQLRQWAVDAYVAPLDKVSTDSQTWIKAPMIPELQMDYLLEISADSYYGPTTVGAVREFLARGEITTETVITNCKTGEEMPLSGHPNLLPPETEEPPTVRLNVRQHLQGRIRELEEALVEERRLRKCAEELRTKAEARAAELQQLLTEAGTPS